MYPTSVNAAMTGETYTSPVVTLIDNHHQSMNQQPPKTITNRYLNIDKSYPTAHVKIVEQPASKALRFRYECEGRTAGSIPGVNSTAAKKTYPTIEIVGYQGRAVVVVSCVTKDTPYRPHPHNLIGKEGCKSGVCTLEIKPDIRRIELGGLGIQCVKKKDIEAALKAREDIRVDPFKTGFTHRSQPGSINLNAVRLCYQVFIEGDKGRFTVPLKPVVSEPIHDKKSMLELVIHQVCSSASVMGNTQIMLLCEKVAKEDIAVRFFEVKNGATIWQAFGDFLPSDVHKQTSIRLRTPQYHNIDIVEPVKVYVQLQRPSDGEFSVPWPFKFEPYDSSPGILRRKCQRLGLRPAQQGVSHHAGDRWKPPNIPTTATELRPTKQPPVHLCYVASEMTPPPEPISPATNYNHANMPTSCNKPANGNTPLISPNHPHQRGACVEVIDISAPNIELTPTTVEKHNMNGVNGHRQQRQPQELRYSLDPAREQYALQPKCEQQHYEQHQKQQNVQDNRYNNTNIGVWEEQFANVLAFAAAAMSNLNGNSNQFNMQSLLAATAPTGLQHPQWNLPLNNHLHQQPQQPQQQQQQQVLHSSYPMQTVDSVAAVVNDRCDVNNTAAAERGEGGETISNLLNLDSDQLVRVNYDDQSMFRLTTDELQLSNLTISV